MFEKKLKLKFSLQLGENLPMLHEYFNMSNTAAARLITV